jgi:putative endonuclease
MHRSGGREVRLFPRVRMGGSSGPIRSGRWKAPGSCPSSSFPFRDQPKRNLIWLGGTSQPPFHFFRSSEISLSPASLSFDANHHLRPGLDCGGACFRLTRGRSTGAPAPAGGEDAFFHLRKLGYAIGARKFRSPGCRGEIDLIGWDADVLCFIEVKTRTTRDGKAPEAAVDGHNRREVAQVAGQCLRWLPPSCQWRFDIVSVY